MNDGKLALTACLAELQRASGLLDGPLTERKRALALERLTMAGRSLAQARNALAAARPEPDPIPAARPGGNLVVLRERRSPPRS